MVQKVLRDYKVRRVIKEMKVSVEKRDRLENKDLKDYRANKVHREKRVT